MNQGWKTVRVFISSTFRDMQAERDWLVKRVFPALRQRLEPHRLNLVDIDLRWGITREQADNDQVLGLCLQQIDECRPFFVGLLGGRYGWVPSKFPVEVGKRYGWTQHHTGKSVTELEILHGVLNDPAMHGRALFCFRSEDFLRDLKDAKKRRVYVEGPTDEELHELGPEEAERRAAVRRQQLADLRNRIRALSPPMPLFDGYPCTWEAAGSSRCEEALTSLPRPAAEKNEPPDVGCYGGSGRVGGLAGLGNWILDKLERAILDAPELQEHLAAVRTETRDELAEERGFHERFIESHTRVYIGRQQLQDELKAFVTGAEAKPCLVTGPSGSGKSAVLARFCQLSTLNPQPSNTLIPHFVGASPRSTGLRDVLRHLCAELKDALKLEDQIKQDTKELCDQFREFLRKVPTDRRVVLVIDALNQLDEADNAHSLYWLPGQIPPPVRLMVSCIDDPDRTDQPALAAMRSRQPHEIKVGLLTDEERLGIVREIPSVAAKTLDEQQVRLLLANEATRNPLFLLVALEELRGFGSFEQLNQKIAGLPQAGDTLTAIFQQVIRRLGKDFNAATVKEVLTLLACARHGLSERELLDLIEGAGVRIEESAGDLFPILRQLRPYLQSRGPLLDFYHRHLAKATHEEFFKAEAPLTPSLSPSEGERVPARVGEGRSAASPGVHGSECVDLRLATHGRLADYFVGCAKGSDPAREWETGGVRGFAECVLHLVKAGQHDASARLLSNFPFLLHKLRVGLLEGVFEDYEMLRREAPSDATKRLEIWTDFFRERAHLLRRGDAEWPAHKILLQLSVEHADDSPITIAGEIWLAGGRCDWLWLRRVQRVPHVEKNPCLAVVEGHSFAVWGAKALADGRLLSWSGDNTLQIWDSELGMCLSVLEGHTGWVNGALELADGRLLSWSDDGTIRLWNSQNGFCLGILKHSRAVRGVLVLADGRLLSWSLDMTLRLWDGHSGKSLAVLTGHSDGVMGAVVLADGRLLSWSCDGTLRLWDGQNNQLSTHFGGSLLTRVFHMLRRWRSKRQIGACLAVLEGPVHGYRVPTGSGLANAPDNIRQYSDQVGGALALECGYLVSWAGKNLRIWNGSTGACLAVLEGHTDTVVGAVALAEGRLLSWSEDKTLRLWRAREGRLLAVLEGHTDRVWGARILGDGRILSWSYDHTLRLWDGQSGKSLAILAGHTEGVLGALSLPDGRLLSWSFDGTLRFWNGQTGASLSVFRGHTDWVYSVQVLVGGRLLSWAEDTTLRLWDMQGTGSLQATQGHNDRVAGARILRNGRVLTWSSERTLRLWDARDGACVAVLEGHTEEVAGALVLERSRFVSWAKDPRSWSSDPPKDHALRLWDGDSACCLAVLKGHTGEIRGVLALTGGQLLSWSNDRTLRIWDGESGASLVVLEGHSSYVSGALALPDGRLLSWSFDKTLRLWNRQTGNSLAVLEGHTEGVDRAMALGDGRLVSWSNDTTLRIWDGRIGQCLTVLKGHTKLVSGAVVLNDGKLVSWSAMDGTWRLWDSNAGTCLEIVKEDQITTRHPDWVRLREEARTGSREPSDTFTIHAARPARRQRSPEQDWRTARTVFFHHRTIAPTLAAWASDSDTRTWNLLPDGTAVVTEGNGQVCFLKLHHGQRRISLAEAETILPQLRPAP